MDYLKANDSAEMGKYESYKLIYPMGTLQTIDMQKSFFDLMLPSECKLVLIGLQGLAWSSLRKGPTI